MEAALSSYSGIIFGIIAAFLWMSLLWSVHLAIKNAAIVDVGWAICLLILAMGAFSDFGVSQKESVFAFLIGLWAFRLSGFLFVDRLYGKPEEGRYGRLREIWKTNIPFKFFLFFQAQWLLNIFLATPFFIVSRAPTLEWHSLHFFGAGLVLIGVLGETLADLQLKHFKKKKTGGVCRDGLWNWSRHPNYFFESVVWVGFALFATPEPYGALAWIAPALILTTLFKVTGIPATEAQALRSKGDEYRRYQSEVSRFFPLPSKKALMG